MLSSFPPPDLVSVKGNYTKFGTEEKVIPFCSLSDEESQILGYAGTQQVHQLGSDLSLILGSHKAPLKLSVLYKEVTSAGTILRKQHGGLRPRSDTKQRLLLHWSAKDTRKPKGWPLSSWLYLGNSWSPNLLRNDGCSARPESSK